VPHALPELEDTRRMAEPELAALATREERMKELERDRDALLALYAGAILEALDRLDGEERNSVYRMLTFKSATTTAALRVTPILYLQSDICPSAEL